ncbi:hypothetical protein ACW6QP_09240 [Salegentibacter sp. HM20]
MKNLRIFMMAAAISLAAMGTAEAGPKKPKSIQKELEIMLHAAQLKFEEDVTAEIVFTFNKNQELVILSVETNEPDLAHLIRQRLNYKTVEMPAVVANSYVLPVRIKA